MEEQVFPCSLWRMWKYVDPVVHRGPILEEFVKDYSLWKQPLLRMKQQHTGHSHHSPRLNLLGGVKSIGNEGVKVDMGRTEDVEEV